MANSRQMLEDIEPTKRTKYNIEFDFRKLKRAEEFKRVNKSKASQDLFLDEQLIYSMRHAFECELAQEWLSFGANPRARHSLALYFCEQARTAQVLIDHGANLHELDDRAFWGAVREANIQKMTVLLHNGAFISEAKLSKILFRQDNWNSLDWFFGKYIDPHSLLRYLGIQESAFKNFYTSYDFIKLSHRDDLSTLTDDELLNEVVVIMRKDNIPLSALGPKRALELETQTLLSLYFSIFNM